MSKDRRQRQLQLYQPQQSVSRHPFRSASITWNQLQILESVESCISSTSCNLSVALLVEPLASVGIAVGSSGK